MIARRTVVLLVAVLGSLVSGCSTCRNTFVSSAAEASPGDGVITLSTRECGSVEGWIVKLSVAGLGDQEIFRGVMPPPTSVSDVRDAVTVRWREGRQIVIATPKWILTTLVKHELGPIKITYESNDVPYPTPQSAGR